MPAMGPCVLVRGHGPLLKTTQWFISCACTSSESQFFHTTMFWSDYEHAPCYEGAGFSTPDIHNRINNIHPNTTQDKRISPMSRFAALNGDLRSIPSTMTIYLLVRPFL